MSKIKKHHWFPFFHDAWVIGTLGLTFQQQGIYLRLLLMQFNDGHVDLGKLAKMYPAMTDEQNEDARRILEQYFVSIDDGPQFWNERLQEIMDEQQDKSERRGKQLERARAAKKSSVATSVTKAVTTTATKARKSAKKRTNATSVASTDTQRELELELELDTEPEIEEKKERKGVTKTQRASAKSQTFIDRWNKVADENPGKIAAIRQWTRNRQDTLRDACKDEAFEELWDEAVKKLPIPNRPGFNWQPTFEWTMKLKHLLRIVEGNYGQVEPTQADKMRDRVEGFLND